MKFLVDTSVLIDILDNKRAALAWYRHYKGSPLFVSALTLVELETGFYKISNPAPQRRELAKLLRDFKILPFAAADAKEAGRIVAHLELGGRQTGYTDSLLAAQAKRLKMVVATSNQRDFTKISGLKVHAVSKK